MLLHVELLREGNHLLLDHLETYKPLSCSKHRAIEAMTDLTNEHGIVDISLLILTIWPTILIQSSRTDKENDEQDARDQYI